ncbi:ATP-sulfurylase PUA-like domain containing protein [Trema orientale]|uniref:ATP-sulfurylase PUA-like domain containing protein n=1 Tax=Trema orientale TaxID=63057 RepID=A0A2P5FKW6_TREOI|nr:ATP-sulfurylase PUA-like domain containing protein [Trema orientale]
MHSLFRSVQAPIKSSLIEPDCGKLADLVVPETNWLRREGWASPLRGFIREDKYLQSFHFNSLRTKDGFVVNMSLPIVLAIDDETKERIGSSTNVGLVAELENFFELGGKI